MSIRSHTRHSRPRHRAWLRFAAAAALCLRLAAQTPVAAEYTYDANNQLVRATDSEGNVVTYEYDFGGNLTGILRSTTADLGPPSVSSDPATINADETIALRIDGGNLLLAEIAVANPSIRVDRFRANDSHVLVHLELPADATVGPTQLTLTTPLGAATYDLNVLGPRPVILSAFPRVGGSTGGTSVRLTGRNLTPDTGVWFGTQPVAPTFENDGLLVVESPPGEAGQSVDITAVNGNGTTVLVGGFGYSFPFAVPGAIGVANTTPPGSLRVSLLEPAVELTTVTIVSDDPSLVAVQESLSFQPGERVKTVPVQGIANGVTRIVTALGSAGLSTAVFVTDPYEGPIALHARPVGACPLEGALGPPVGVVCVPRRLPNAVLASGQSRSFVVPLPAPVGPGGLTLTLVVESPQVVGAPDEIVLSEGATEVEFTLEALASGNSHLSIRGEGVELRVGVFVDVLPLADGPFAAAPVGIYATPVGSTSARPVGAYATPVDETRAPPVGAEVDAP